MQKLRTFEIIDFIKARKRCSIDELMSKFKVSSATIHRDIAGLAARDIVTRVRGGVAFVDAAAGAVRSPRSYIERRAAHSDAKGRIARKALAYIQEGDIIFLDSSTTVTHLAEALTASTFANLTLVTNSVAVMGLLRRMPPHYVRVGLGGTYDPQLNSFLGESTFRELDRLSITKSFVSCFGLNDKIATTNHESQSSLIPRVLDKAERNYLLVDRTKLGRTGLYRLSARGTFAEIITD